MPRPAVQRDVGGSVTRRTFLRGSGGITVGLPLLPSLLPARAHAAGGLKRFVAMCTNHGGITPANMMPTEASLNATTTLWGNHKARHGKLIASKVGANTSLSAVLTAPTASLSDRLVGKMNVLRGFNIPYYIGHHTGGHLGNFVRSDQGPQNLRPFPTIDQVMAWSPAFYRDLTGVKQRSMVTGFDFRGISWGWSNPSAKSGSVQKMAVQSNSLALFDQLFTGVMPMPAGTPGAPKRKPIVDRVLENYKSLRQSNRRLSVDDRARLDAHVSRLGELDRRLSVAAPSLLTCTAKKPATGVQIRDEEPGAAECARRYRGLNDVVAMGLACGVSRVATVCVFQSFSDYKGSWHQDIAHNHTAPDKQKILMDALRWTFEAAVLDLAAKLDSYEDAPGVSLLDNTLLQWTQESGPVTHDTFDMVVVTFGGAAGYFKTGNYVDFRNPAGGRNGLQMRQWMATALQAMDVPRNEFEFGGKTGYGDPFADSGFVNAVAPEVMSRASDPVGVVSGAAA